jgi:hypothetical protein
LLSPRHALRLARWGLGVNDTLKWYGYAALQKNYHLAQDDLIFYLDDLRKWGGGTLGYLLSRDFSFTGSAAYRANRTETKDERDERIANEENQALLRQTMRSIENPNEPWQQFLKKQTTEDWLERAERCTRLPAIGAHGWDGNQPRYGPGTHAWDCVVTAATKGNPKAKELQARGRAEWLARQAEGYLKAGDALNAAWAFSNSYTLGKEESLARLEAMAPQLKSISDHEMSMLLNNPSRGDDLHDANLQQMSDIVKAMDRTQARPETYRNKEELQHLRETIARLTVFSCVNPQFKDVKPALAQAKTLKETADKLNAPGPSPPSGPDLPK